MDMTDRRMTDDRQSETDRVTEKCVGVGGIAHAATAIPPNNT